jgi:YD repeat-containing protein
VVARVACSSNKPRAPLGAPPHEGIVSSEESAPLFLRAKEIMRMTDREHAAWQGFLTLHATLTDEIDRSLRESHGLTLQHFEVLLHLEEAPGNRMRMGDLASSVRLSQSGASRLVDRVERAGHIVRQECDADGRVLYAQLSESGKAQLLEARPTYVAGVQDRFLERFDVRVLRKLAAGWQRSRPMLTALAVVAPELPISV